MTYKLSIIKCSSYSCIRDFPTPKVVLNFEPRICLAWGLSSWSLHRCSPVMWKLSLTQHACVLLLSEKYRSVCSIKLPAYHSQAYSLMATSPLPEALVGPFRESAGVAENVPHARMNWFGLGILLLRYGPRPRDLDEARTVMSIGHARMTKRPTHKKLTQHV